MLSTLRVVVAQHFSLRFMLEIRLLLRIVVVQGFITLGENADLKGKNADLREKTTLRGEPRFFKGKMQM